MTATASVKNPPKTIEWMAPAAHLRKSTTVKKMNDQSLLISVNEITHYFKKWATGSGVLKNIYFLYENVMLQIDLLKVAVPKNSSIPKEL